MQNMALDKLCQQIATLKHQAEQFDKAKHFAKNRYMQKQPSLFEQHVFATKSMNLTDYVNEIQDEVERLPPSEHRHTYGYALDRITSQFQAVLNVIKSTPIWQKENKNQFRPAKPKVYQQAVKKIMQSSHELYEELKQNHEFERRLILMIEERKLHMANLGPANVKKVNQEILVLHGRLGRCRKAISATEDKIQKAEKQQLK
ncbi:MAG: primosomal replication protein [Pseudoalteromonas sp.]|uniref:primosomal replication protein n=1 Tax=unclassified Pseudoalteromonas TaxID=194690 RepID=UPI003F945DC7